MDKNDADHTKLLGTPREEVEEWFQGITEQFWDKIQELVDTTKFPKALTGSQLACIVLVTIAHEGMEVFEKTEPKKVRQMLYDVGEKLGYYYAELNSK